jgi:hypothetical protein
MTSTAEASSPSARFRTSTVLPRAMSPTLSASSRVPLGSVSSAHRDGSGGAEWYRQTPSYAGRLDTFGQIGSPGQDLRRLAVGPALYLNGPPDKGNKATIATATALRRYGAFGTDAGPGAVVSLLERRSACKRSAMGPDPYDTMVRARRAAAVLRARASPPAVAPLTRPPVAPRRAPRLAGPTQRHLAQAAADNRVPHRRRAGAQLRVVQRGVPRDDAARGHAPAVVDRPLAVAPGDRPAQPRAAGEQAPRADHAQRLDARDATPLASGPAHVSVLI